MNSCHQNLLEKIAKNKKDNHIKKLRSEITNLESKINQLSITSDISYLKGSQNVRITFSNTDLPDYIVGRMTKKYIDILQCYLNDGSFSVLYKNRSSIDNHSISPDDLNYVLFGDKENV